MPALSTGAAALAERIADGRFYVACVGQFKRGKATLQNALLGQELLPAGVVPVTSVVTVVRYGESYAVIQFRDRTERASLANLSAYVTEKENPENAKAVVAVEAFVPSPLLASGMYLVDTPGIGSVHLGNTIEESRQRVERLRHCAAESERALGDLAHLLTAEEERLGKLFLQTQDAFLARAVPIAHTELERAFRGLTGSRAGCWREGNRLAREVFHRFLDRWRTEQEPCAEMLYRDATKRFTDLANSFLDRIRGRMPSVLGGHSSRLSNGTATSTSSGSCSRMPRA